MRLREILQEYLEERAQKKAIKKYCRICSKGIFKPKDCQIENCALWPYRV